MDGGRTSSNGAHLKAPNPALAALSATRKKSAGVRSVANRERLMFAYSGTLSTGSPPRNSVRPTPARIAPSWATAVRTPLTAVPSTLSLLRPSELSSRSPSTSDSSPTSSSRNSETRSVSVPATAREASPAVISTVVELPSPSETTANVQVELVVTTTEANFSIVNFMSVGVLPYLGTVCVSSFVC